MIIQGKVIAVKAFESVSLCVLIIMIIIMSVFLEHLSM